MIASKYPFLDVHFYKFKVKGEKIWMKLLDYGCVMAKLDLGKDKVNKKSDWTCLLQVLRMWHRRVTHTQDGKKSKDNFLMLAT